MTDDTRVSRRGLLALLGLGGAAAAVASKAEAHDAALAREREAYLARKSDDEPIAQTAACKQPWEADDRPMLERVLETQRALIDPSTYPRVRVRIAPAPDHNWSLAGPLPVREYQAAEVFEPGEFVALRMDGMAVHPTDVSTWSRSVGRCVEYIETPSYALDRDGLRIDGRRVRFDGVALFAESHPRLPTLKQWLDEDEE